MKKFKQAYRLLVFAILAGISSGSVLAQTPYDPDYREEALNIEEELQLFTDRSLYSVNESIYFMADYAVSGLPEGSPWSSVLYVELIAGDGTPLVQSKYRIAGGKAEGSLRIPSESLTGNYYVKAYTRWMRNRGPQDFSYTALKIINPYRSEVLVLDDQGASYVSADQLIFKEGVLECSTASGAYQSGQEVEFCLNAASSVLLDQLRCCLTVAPEGAIDLIGGSYRFPDQERDSFRVAFLPDLGNGISISGSVLSPDLQPVPYATLHFALLGKEPDFFATMSDINGRFILTVPAAEGERLEFFVTPEQEKESGLEVRIDEEFDSRAMGLPFETFHLTDYEREIARKITLNMQISNAFSQALSPAEVPFQETVAEGKRIPFYGTRVKRLYIDDYIRLPNLEEVFINLVPELQFYKKGGETRIRVLSSNESIRVYNPLIMIDHISVFDHQALLALSPEKIERVDLINEIYLKGNVAFGGVLAIHSRKGDMAGIDLPKGSYFFDYQNFQPENVITASPSLTEERVPDARNTVFWAADIRLEGDKQTKVSFRAPEQAGKYLIQVRGVLPGGEVFSASSEFLVE
ncbi:MAG: hypothetical protein P1P86_06955 [Bacteroidales bacterium]|nr:hypothetical protein [Bacteroidales bacterium]